MAETDIGKTTVSNLTDAISDYSVDTKQTEGALDQEETFFDNTKWTQWFGYYKQIPELKKAIDALAVWVLGKGYDADPETTVILDHITGWGEDTFKAILWNMLVTKKIAGDAFAEIMRDPDTGTLVNIKVLDPGSIRIVANRKGIIKRYEQKTKTKDGATKKFQPVDILHLCNDRIADEIHGTSVVEACETIILIRNEAIDILKKSIRRNIYPLKIVHIDTDDQTKINALITKWENLHKDYEMLFVPFGTVPKIEIVQGTLNINDMIGWIKYLENFFYQAIGIPKIILGGSEEFTEASSKIAYLTFEQVYAREQEELQNDLWNQLQLRLTFRQPASLKNELLQSEQKNTGQVGFQPNDTMAGAGK